MGPRRVDGALGGSSSLAFAAVASVLATASACAQPGVGPQGRAGEQGASEPREVGAAAIACGEVPKDALAWVEHSPCALILERDEAALAVRTTRVGAPSDWSGAPPEACLEAGCNYELISSEGMIFVLGIELRPDSPVPRQLWLGGPALVLPARAPSAYVPLWGGECISADSSDFGPVYELRPYHCAQSLRLELGAREPAAALEDAPEQMREWLELMGALPTDGACRPLDGVSR